MDSFHPGEQALQTRAGSRERLAQIGERIIRPDMSEQIQAFFAQLPYVVLAARDGSGQPWATLLTGKPGFIRAHQPERLALRAELLAGDPLAGGLRNGAAVGLLGLAAQSRRRNRVNGTILTSGEGGLELAVTQSFGNCPKYIVPRAARHTGGIAAPTSVSRQAGLSAAARALVARADTFFIASCHPEAGLADDARLGMDVSHRGGAPGFVTLDDQHRLLIEDFAGNNYFNTLGNLLLNPRCGLLFVDFDQGDLIWLAAEAEVIESGAELAPYPGVARLLRLRITESRHRPGPLPVHWSPIAQDA